MCVAPKSLKMQTLLLIYTDTTKVVSNITYERTPIGGATTCFSGFESQPENHQVVWSWVAAATRSMTAGPHVIDAIRNVIDPHNTGGTIEVPLPPRPSAGSAFCFRLQPAGANSSPIPPCDTQHSQTPANDGPIRIGTPNRSVHLLSFRKTVPRMLFAIANLLNDVKKNWCYIKPGGRFMHRHTLW